MRLTEIPDETKRRNLQRWAKEGLLPAKQEAARGRAWVLPDDWEQHVERVDRLLRAGFTMEETRQALAKLKDRPEGVVIAKGEQPAPRNPKPREIDVVRLRDLQNLGTESGTGKYPVTFVSFAKHVERPKGSQEGQE